MEEEVTVQIEENCLSKAERTLRPITYVSWLLGVGVARPLKCPKAVTVILRIFHFGVCSVIVAYGAIDFFTFGSVFKSDIFKIMYYMNKVVCYISSYYYVLHGIRHYRKWPELMKKMDSLDQKIRKEVPMNDGSITNGQILAIIAICAFGPMSLLIHALYYYFTIPEDIFASDLLLYYTIAQSLANSFTFDIVVYMICRRFRAINELIERLDEGMGASWIALKVRRVRELHNGVFDLVTVVNDIYGIYLIFSSANSFMMVVAQLFRIYMSVVEKNYDFIFINNIIWVIYAGQFAIICWICMSACRESDKTGITIHSIILNAKSSTKYNKLSSFRNCRRREIAETEAQNENDRAADGNERPALNYYGMESLLRTNFERDCVRNEVNDFSSQLQQHRVAFTACDFFEMNNSLLTGFIGVITTYLIILVQFYRPENLQSSRHTRKR